MTSGSPSTPFKKITLIYFSTVPWEFIHQRMHALCLEFAARGHRVYFVEPMRTKRGYRMAFNKGVELLHITPSLLEGDESGVREVVVPRRFQFGPMKIRPRDVDKWRAKWLVKFVNETGRVFGDPVALIVSSADWDAVLRDARFDFAALDFIDDPTLLADFVAESKYREREASTVSSSDIVFTTADSLTDYVRDNYPAAKIELLPNAVDTKWFVETAKSSQTPVELADIPRPVVGYIGALYEWIDLPLLIRVAKTKPDVSFVFVGLRREGGAYDEFVNMPNVRFLGEKPYTTMPAWVRSFDACIIPFAEGSVAKSTNPKKLYEYLALGKPTVVTSCMEDTVKVADVVYRATGPDEFVRCLDAALSENDSELVARRIEYARNNSWQSRVDRIEAIVRAKLDSKGESK